MNNIKHKKNKSLLLLIIILMIFITVIYFINRSIVNYKAEILNNYTVFSQLENEKNKLSKYKKILSTGSKESLQIKKYIMSDNIKVFLGFINELEEYARRNNLSSNGSPIVSVIKRENAAIKKYNAGDVFINIKVSGDDRNIENFLNLINNLPYISYIEKIDIRHDFVNKKSNADISLIIYQKYETK